MERVLTLLTKLWHRFEERSGKENWVRVIYREDRPLIIRYYLFSTRWIDDITWLRLFRRFSFRIVMHQMFESDDDGLHDHPWPWASLVLSGGYYEQTPDGEFWRPPGHLRFRSANAFHRLVLDPNLERGCFTLFAMGQRQREWGFLRSDGSWEPWFEHVGSWTNRPEKDTLQP
jgi:hypothetical protein